jgi:hypothetical protein
MRCDHRDSPCREMRRERVAQCDVAGVVECARRLVEQPQRPREQPQSRETYPAALSL